MTEMKIKFAFCFVAATAIFYRMCRSQREKERMADLKFEQTLKSKGMSPNIEENK